MDDIRIGQVCRALRRRRGWRQADLAARAGCSQATISRLERGHLEHLDVAAVRRVFRALEARYEGLIRWRAGDLDRLLDERHAALVEEVGRRTERLGWSVHPELTYARYGDRGSIDLIGIRPTLRAVAIFEMKTDLPRVEETIRRHDDKARIASALVRERFGFGPAMVGRILAMPEDPSLRRIVKAHLTTFRAAYPASGRDVRAWLTAPTGALAGLWFLSGIPLRTGSRDPAARKRVRVRKATLSKHEGNQSEGVTPPNDSPKSPRRHS